jgi:hypothetical protein
MQYQIVKHNKTGSRTLGFYPSVADTKCAMSKLGLQFREVSYMGGFPVYADPKGKTHSVQGYAETVGVVCSLPDEDVKELSR